MAAAGVWRGWQFTSRFLILIIWQSTNQQWMWKLIHTNSQLITSSNNHYQKRAKNISNTGLGTRKNSLLHRGKSLIIFFPLPPPQRRGTRTPTINHHHHRELVLLRARTSQGSVLGVYEKYQMSKNILHSLSQKLSLDFSLSNIWERTCGALQFVLGKQTRIGRQ